MTPLQSRYGTTLPDSQIVSILAQARAKHAAEDAAALAGRSDLLRVGDALVAAGGAGWLAIGAYLAYWLL